MRVVIDASVAMKWLVPEEDTDRARSLISVWNSGRLYPVAPSLIMAEVANALWKKVKKGQLHSGVATRLFHEFTLLSLPLVPTEELVFPALDFSFRYGHPVYDCIYVALAVKERGFLVTSDEALARKFTNPKPKAKQVIQLLKNWHP